VPDAVCLLLFSSESKDSQLQAEGKSMLRFNPGQPVEDERSEFELGRLLSLTADMEALRRGSFPESLTDAEAPILENWEMARRPIPCLVGHSFGHPRLIGSGRPIMTSDLWLMSADQSWARTLSRWYRLGRPAGHAGDHA